MEVIICLGVFKDKFKKGFRVLITLCNYKKTLNLKNASMSLENIFIPDFVDHIKHLPESLHVRILIEYGILFL